MNTSSALSHCWHEQSCYPCLHSSFPCSWCVASSTCVANPARLHLLAPIFHPGVCPLKDERWELRAKLLGCKVSALTFLSVIVSVAATLVTLVIVWGLSLLSRWAWPRRVRARSMLAEYRVVLRERTMTVLSRLKTSEERKDRGTEADLAGDERARLLA